MISTSSLNNGMQTIEKTLNRSEQKLGAAEAKAIARATISEYVRATPKSEFDYGVLCGALDWLSQAEGLYK